MAYLLTRNSKENNYYNQLHLINKQFVMVFRVLTHVTPFGNTARRLNANRSGARDKERVCVHDPKGAITMLAMDMPRLAWGAPHACTPTPNRGPGAPVLTRLRYQEQNEGLTGNLRLHSRPGTGRDQLCTEQKTLQSKNKDTKPKPHFRDRSKFLIWVTFVQRFKCSHSDENVPGFSL